jgi:peptide/nickel transport system permease protein
MTDFVTSVQSASQWQLIAAKFKEHKLALASLWVLGAFYFIALFGPFLAPYGTWKPSPFAFAPPARIHILHDGNLFRPMVEALTITFNSRTFDRSILPDRTRLFSVRFFVRGDQYRWLGMVTCNIHLFGTDEGGQINLMGTDILGRDCFSRDVIATEISVTVGLVGVLITFVLGCLIGGASGYYGGVVDMLCSASWSLSLVSLPFLCGWPWARQFHPPGVTCVYILR